MITIERSSKRTSKARRRKRKRHLPSLLKILLTFIIFPALAAILINLYIVVGSSANMATTDELSSLDADCILVLGAGIQADGTPSPILAERLDTAIALYENGASKTIIVSGGDDAAQSEVSAMRNYLLEAGIPSLAISTDTHGTDTFASVKNLRNTYEMQNVILVSQRFHLYRAIYIAKKMDLTVSGCPASANDIHDTKLLRREFAARVKDFIQCNFGELPLNSLTENL